MSTTYFVSWNIAVSSDRNDLSDKEVLELARETYIRHAEAGDLSTDDLEWYDTEEDESEEEA